MADQQKPLTKRTLTYYLSRIGILAVAALFGTQFFLDSQESIKADWQAENVRISSMYPDGQLNAYQVDVEYYRTDSLWLKFGNFEAQLKTVNDFDTWGSRYIVAPPAFGTDEAFRKKWLTRYYPREGYERPGKDQGINWSIKKTFNLLKLSEIRKEGSGEATQ